MGRAEVIETAGSTPSKRPANYSGFQADVRSFLPEEQIIADPLRLVTMGTDASCYRLTPKLIVIVEDETQVQCVIEAASRFGVPITFRAAGTSLSGQAVTDSVLVKLGMDGWRDWSVNKDASLVTAEPALTGAQVNRRLARHGRKIGPDPASIASAMIGGIAANNASGMCCGIDQNSYRTLQSMRIILADGTILDTGDETSRLIFQQSHAPLLDALRDLGVQTRANEALSARIKKKYAIKNTMGYAINALIDYEDPVDILEHLMIGSEGTLGFMSEITYRTVPDPRHKAAALAFFPDIRRACEAVAILKSAPVAAVELVDYRGLTSVRGKPGMPDFLNTMPEGTSALLIEVQAESKDEALGKAETCGAAIAQVESLEPIVFTTDPALHANYWKMRKGLFPAVGAVRETGTTVIIEDVAVTTDQLADAVLDLVGLFEKHHYDEAIIFGHALEGNVHFVFTQGFSTPQDITRYAAFMDDITALIVEKYDGSLKAEHSTGRNMAPFLEMEWGAQALGLMRQIKALLDPAEILNPGVILTEDPRAHLNDLKPMPAARDIVDKCIECGFCEATCPTRAYTLTPRQRIVGLREMARLEQDGSGRDARKLRKQIAHAYEHAGVDSCAGDSLCSMACPVGIDTGEAMRQIRHEKTGAISRTIANGVSHNFGFVVGVVRVAMLGAGAMRRVVGDGFMTWVSTGLNRISGGAIPAWQAAMPMAAAPPVVHEAAEDGDRIVYFPSCATRVMGPAPQDPETAPLPEVIYHLLTTAGYSVVSPQKQEKLCCGMPFNSKGFIETGSKKRDELVAALNAASRDGKDPIVFDTSPCAMRTREAAEAAGLTTYDLTEALDTLILNRIDLEKTDEEIALHITCSARRMGLDQRLTRIARAVSDNVIIPADIQCCGFSGDKGFNQPALNASALRNLKASLPDTVTTGYSTSRTCEIGLSTHSGRPYHSIAYLINRLAKPRVRGSNTTKAK